MLHSTYLSKKTKNCKRFSQTLTVYPCRNICIEYLVETASSPRQSLVGSSCMVAWPPVRALWSSKHKKGWDRRPI